MNQNEAAEYIDMRGIPMIPSDLSRLAKFGCGPEFTKKSGHKDFTTSDLDAWIAEERERRDQELAKKLNPENRTNA